ncbi:MFS transporter [Bradyrhizobium sp. BR 10261]|uniref:MFS transporter n=1 Tax=Bradyrhizobium sp. BR 10261 TaxID=2749992 RepID=UPI001C64663A|nr:MFS transporter [Bradyrhizobium sp. BR 10261]MBW7961442.1 MFS transporter [Bradyrhizobium sp. BR 10261]
METEQEVERPQLGDWWLVGVLCLVNAVAFIDRAALPLLVQPIKRDLQISDTLMSFLIGAAFIITYAVGGWFVGMLVDRFPRRRVLAMGMTVWGISTMLCGSVTTYAGLFLGRCGVGAGEATCGPSSMSLVRDAFHPRFRGRAVAIWAMGASIGGGLALLGGGAILHFVGESGSYVLPLLGITVRSWQLVLIMCGAIALPVALLVYTFKEPARRSVGTGQPIALRDAFEAVRDRWLVFVPLFLGNAATIMLSVAYSSWIPAFLGRVWKIPAGEIGLTYGLIVLFLSTASQFIAGFLVDAVYRRFGLPAIPALGVGISALIFLPAVLVPLAGSIVAVWMLLAVFNLLAASLFTIGTSTIVHLSPGAAIGKITAVHFAWVGITGTAIAPTLVAVVAAQFFQGTLGSALSTVGGALAAIGGLCLLVVHWQLRPGHSVPSLAREAA